MLTVSSQAYAAFEASERETFIASLAEMLGDEMPDHAQGLPPDRLAAIARTSLERAEQWEIADEEAIGLMCGIALGFGEDIFDDPDVAKLLRGHVGDVTARLHQLLDAFDDLG